MPERQFKFSLGQMFGQMFWLCKHFNKQPPKVFCKKNVLNNFPNFTGQHLCWSLFIIALQTWAMKLFYKETPTQRTYAMAASTFLKELHIRK